MGDDEVERLVLQGRMLKARSMNRHVRDAQALGERARFRSLTLGSLDADESRARQAHGHGEDVAPSAAPDLEDPRAREHGRIPA